MHTSTWTCWARRLAIVVVAAALVGCGSSPPPLPQPVHEPPPPPPPAPAPPQAEPEPEPEAGRVEMSTAFMMGGDMPTPVRDQVTKDVVQAIKDGTPMFRRCYAKALARDAGTHGEVDIEMIIKPNGSIGVLRPGKGDIQDTALIDCTLRGFEQLRLPTPPADYSIVAPMQFKPE